MAKLRVVGLGLGTALAVMACGGGGGGGGGNGGGGSANLAPTALNDSATTAFETAVVIPVLANDSDSDGTLTTVVISAAPESGQAQVNGDLSVTYSPASGFSGTAQFSYRVTDDGGASATAVVTVTVQAESDVTPPVLTFTAYPQASDERRFASFSFGANEAAQFECSLDDAPFTICVSPVNFQALDYGPHQFRVQAEDSAGNLSAPQSYQWTIESLRPQNNACLAPSRPASAVTLQTAFSSRADLPGEAIVQAAQAPGDAEHWYLADRVGWRILRVNAQGAAPSSGTAPLVDGAQEILDLSCFMNPAQRYDFEYGIMGFAFDPAFDGSGRIFVSYTWDHQGAAYAADTRAVLRVASFPYSSGSSINAACSGAENPCECLDEVQTVIIDRLPRDGVVAGAEATALGNQHYAGHLAFGPEGYLYASFGEGGTDNDVSPSAPYLERPQDPGELFGKLIRININGSGQGPENAYSIPPDNPFGNEVYALGFRNPWRFGIDQESGDIWLADVGEQAREEINRVAAGANYGWPYREGDVDGPRAIPEGETPVLSAPALVYERDQGVSISGGLVYRGTAIPALQGQFIFGDWLDTNIRALVDGRGESPSFSNLTIAPSGVIAFAEDQQGELYTITSNGDQFLKLVPSEHSSSTFPLLLSQSPCFEQVEGRVSETPVNAMVPFSVNMPLWSDDASKERYLALPEGEQMSLAASGDFVFPLNTVLVKNFRVGAQQRLVETRLFVRHDDGEWAGYSYAWNEEGSDAVFRPNGHQQSYDGVSWQFPSSAQCLSCHTQGAGRSLGLEVLQQSAHANPVFGGSDMERFIAMGLIDTSAVDDLAALGALRRQDASHGEARTSEIHRYRQGGANAAQRDDVVRSYLHANCAGCHRGDAGSVIPQLDFRYSTSLADSAACDVSPTNGAMGVTPLDAARIIAPGNANNSVLYRRISAEGGGQMPPLGRAVVDEDMVALIADWINVDLSVCP